MNLSIQYRPKSLHEIIGHTKIVTELVKRSTIFDFPNVMMFSGKTGIGKTTFQLIIAKNILCQNKVRGGNSCNQCEICKSIDNDIMNNYCYIYNASNIGIDEMRSIESIAISKSLSIAKSKVIIIDELQELSNNKKAQKNILKLLEKPLKNTYFILGTMDEFKVDKAILNRSVKYKLNELNEEEIGDCLINICEKEKIDLNDNNDYRIQTLIIITQNSEGSLRTAISYLERVIYSNLWNSDDLIKELGIISTEQINYIIDDLLSGKIEVLQNKINSDFITKITNTLLLYYKVMSGYELEIWRQNSLLGIRKHSIEKVQYVINKLFELTKYYYITQSLIDFTLVDIINFCKIKV